MYEEGFRWWNLGCGGGDRVRALRDHPRGDGAPARCCGGRSRREHARRGRPVRDRAPRRARGARRSSRWRRSCGWCPRRSCRPARRPRCRSAGCPSAPTLEHYRTLFARMDLGRQLLNSVIVAARDDRARGARERRRRATRSRSSASAGAIACCGLMLLGARRAGADRDAAALPARAIARAREHARGRRRSRGSRASSASSSCGSTRSRSRTASSTPRVSTARASSAIFRRIALPLIAPDPGDARRLHVPRRVERFSLAARRARRRRRAIRCPWDSRASRASTCRTPSS